MILGHGHPAVLEAVQKAAVDGFSFGAPTEREIELAEAIIALVPSVEQVRLVSSGTEAGMSALRLARGATGRSKIVKFEGCYHGHADALLVKAGSGLATFGHPTSAGVPPEVVQHTLVLEYNNVAQLEEAFASPGREIACVMIEPIAGNMNFVRASVPFMKRLRELCTQHGALLVFDEVMTGFRVALGGAQSVYARLIPGFKPDMSVFGKVIGGGMPLAAFGGTRDVMSQLAPLGPVYQAGTLSGNPVATACGLATLKEISPSRASSRRCRPRTRSLVDGLDRRGARRRRALVGDSEGGMFGFFFADALPQNYGVVMATDKERFNRFFHGMLDRGVYLAPGACTKPASSARRTRGAPAKVPGLQQLRRAAAGAAAGRALRQHGRDRPLRALPPGVVRRPCTSTSWASAAPSWAALAALAREAGHRVTGCDANVYPPMSDQLRALGIELIEGLVADQLALAPDVFVVGNVVTRARQPADGGRARRRRALHQRPAVAGRPRAAGPARAGGGRHARQDHDHRDAGLDPGPGRPAAGLPDRRRAAELRRLGAAGQRPHFVIEADEYDTALFDKRSKFVHYRPRTAILNNLEHDHADIFPDLAAIETQFHHLVRTVPPAAGWSSMPATRRCSACWRAAAGARCSASARARGRARACCARAASRMPSTCCAAACASAASTGRCWASTTSSMRWPPSPRPSMWAWRPMLAAAALGSFENVRRRLELRGACGGVSVYDDFAHHPTAMRAHARRPAPQARCAGPGGRAAHPGGLRAALQHHEAGHDEGPAALGAGEADLLLLPAGRLRLERARGARPMHCSMTPASSSPAA
jgi:glutamate-1-semialdehyde 2,1-aminomutase